MRLLITFLISSILCLHSNAQTVKSENIFVSLAPNYTAYSSFYCCHFEPSFSFGIGLDSHPFNKGNHILRWTNSFNLDHLKMSDKVGLYQGKGPIRSINKMTNFSMKSILNYAYEKISVGVGLGWFYNLSESHFEYNTNRNIIVNEQDKVVLYNNPALRITGNSLIFATRIQYQFYDNFSVGLGYESYFADGENLLNQLFFQRHIRYLRLQNYSLLIKLFPWRNS